MTETNDDLEDLLQVADACDVMLEEPISENIAVRLRWAVEEIRRLRNPPQVTNYCPECVERDKRIADLERQLADAVEDLAEYKEEVPKLHRFHRGFRDDVFATIADLKAQLATRPTREQVDLLDKKDVRALLDKEE